jgi:ABC-2 type transport system permease protein
MISAVYAVVVRELIRFKRQRGRLVASFARPLLWLVVIGAGFEKLVPTQGTVSYKQFLLPGLFGMVILFSTMLTALATVHDREFGPIRMLLIAPLPRPLTVISKTIAAAMLGVIQCVLLFPLIWILGLRPSPSNLLLLLFGIALTSLTLAALGMVIASRMRSIENFAGIMNFLMFPMFFLSSALYPAVLLPGWLQPFVRANPLTYGIDLMRHPLLQGLYPGNLGTDYRVAFDILVLTLVSAVLLALASMLFGEEEHLGRILLNETPRARGSQAPRSGRGGLLRRGTPSEPAAARAEVAPASSPALDPASQPD